MRIHALPATPAPDTRTLCRCLSGRASTLISFLQRCPAVHLPPSPSPSSNAYRLAIRTRAVEPTALYEAQPSNTTGCGVAASAPACAFPAERQTWKGMHARRRDRFPAPSANTTNGFRGPCCSAPPPAKSEAAAAVHALQPGRRARQTSLRRLRRFLLGLPLVHGAVFSRPFRSSVKTFRDPAATHEVLLDVDASFMTGTSSPSRRLVVRSQLARVFDWPPRPRSLGPHCERSTAPTVLGLLALVCDGMLDEVAFLIALKKLARYAEIWSDYSSTTLFVVRSPVSANLTGRYLGVNDIGRWTRASPDRLTHRLFAKDRLRRTPVRGRSPSPPTLLCLPSSLVDAHAHARPT
ncbi:hypothetical protein PLICRDRAFT_180216 [Plicaturopsis crispa FD-325 SS-3]|uniref:Uncharacterized protein n=1 Tax=Plicaturopsis crispa FD-325 SS-3 TaxID=944288 RepID=A0A0C9SKE7_PLICR|nr:hypothetical protein PLICRDRAFT_180216 [Plicaturopsis crispa FD-325 SS-3]